MSLTERIIEIFGDARARGALDQKIDEALFRIGCTHIVHRADMIIVYYDDYGVERLIVLFDLKRWSITASFLRSASSLRRGATRIKKRSPIA